MRNSLFARITLAALAASVVAVLLAVVAGSLSGPPASVVWTLVILAVGAVSVAAAWFFTVGIKGQIQELTAWLGEFVRGGKGAEQPPEISLRDCDEHRHHLQKLAAWQQELLDISWAAREGDLRRRLSKRGEQDPLPTAFNGLLDDLNQANLQYAEAISYLHAIPAPIQVVDRELNIRFINQAGARAARLAVGQCIGKKCHEIFRTRDCNSDRCKVVRAMIQNRVLTGENVSTTAKGESPYRYTAAPLKDDNGRVIGAVEYIVDIRDEMRVVAMAEAIAQGDYGISIEPRSEDDRLSLALNRMAATLRDLVNKQAEDRWLENGVATVGDRLHGEHDQLSLAHNILEALAEVLEVRAGAFYLAQDEDTLQLIKTFGTDGEIRRTVGRDDGLIARALAQGRVMMVNDLPPGYLKVSSTLGEADATALAVLPVYFENELRCLIELGGHRPFGPREELLLQRVAENIGVAVHTTEVRYELARLLETTQEQAEKLQVQQEELRQTNNELQEQARALAASEERLQVQQEELRVSNEELEEHSKTLAEKNRENEAKNKELQRARAELEEKARALEISGRYKSEFLANMSHELRTPLNSILILSQLLAANKESNLQPRQLEFANTIHNSGSDLLHLINEVLDLSKIEAGRMEINPENVNVKAMADGLLGPFKPMAEQKGIGLESSLAEGLPTAIFTDETRLRQILKNLLSNAFKFTETGGVTLEVGRPEPDRLPPGVSFAPEEGIFFSVRDTGIGIAPDKLEVVFEAFKQADGTTSRKFGGTGLGLSISRQLARLLGGELTIESEVGKGSTFTLWLPEKLSAGRKGAILPGPAKSDSAPWSAPRSVDKVGRGTAADEPGAVGGDSSPAQEARPSRSETAAELSSGTVSGANGGPAQGQDSSAAGAPSVPVPPPEQDANAMVRDDRRSLSRGDKSLLIIEDDSSFSSLLLDLAREKGYKGLVAEDGETGLHLADYYRPSGILLDMGLPGISGREVMERLKKNPETRHIPVHFISASDQSADVLQLGAIGFLTKPVSVEKLEQVFSRIEKLAESPVKRLLVVEDDLVQRQAIRALIGDGTDVDVVEATSGEEAHERLQKEHFDCVILDLGLGDMSGFDLLTKIKEDRQIGQVPVVIYTGRDIDPEEEERLQQYADSVIIKGARSPERLLDETTLFLHRMEKSLPNEQQEILKTLHSRESTFQGRTVLLVDDDMRNIFALSSVLEESGLEIVVARDGRESLDKLAQHPEIDLVLMDIMMPEMDGYEAMREIRRDPRKRDLPIIALTAKAMRGDKDKCLAAGANDYLAKPVDPERLLSLLRVWLYR